MHSPLLRRTGCVVAATLVALLTGCSDAAVPTAPARASQVSPSMKIGGLSITITAGPNSLTVGQQAPYTAVATDRHGRPVSPGAITWLSSTPSVVSMQGNVATALTAGTATIFATFYGGTAQRQVTVTVPLPPVTHLLLNYQLKVDTLGRPSLIGSDGLNEQLLLSFGPGFHHFDLSPDRSRLTFAKAFDNRIFTSNADGSNVQVLVPSLTNYVPKWSADGLQIVWAREVTPGANGLEIFKMSADGSNQTQLTFNNTVDVFPNMSPDASKIVFESNRSGNYEIWVMDADGMNQRPLTSSPATDGKPIWSPDGSRIVFVSDRSGATQVHSMSADGSDVRQLTNVPGIRSDVPLALSPDGSRIAFGRDLNGQGSAWLVNADGTQLTQFRVPDASRTWEFISSWRK